MIKARKLIDPDEFLSKIDGKRKVIEPEVKKEEKPKMVIEKVIIGKKKKNEEEESSEEDQKMIKSNFE